MAKKQVRNKFRDKLAEYYLINREITKEADARYKTEKEEGKKQPWSGKEKMMLFITIVAAVLLIIKYAI